MVGLSDILLCRLAPKPPLLIRVTSVATTDNTRRLQGATEPHANRNQMSIAGF